ncbi:MAG: lysylphosphatidylglycerol synthase transmembrane domain-containing protein [Actinomycetota bacterium]
MAALSGLSARTRGALGALAGALVLGATIATVGTGAFLRGLSSLSAATIGIAVLLAALATAAAAWRWRTVAAGLGLRLPFFAAATGYYRSQFLNSVLPGGVIGDVHRAYRHGRRAGRVALAARAVAMERIAGQVVQLAIVAIVLGTLGITSPLRAIAWVVVGVVTLLVITLAVLAATARGRRMLQRELDLLRRVFSSGRRSLQIVTSSVVIVACHATTFVVACLATGVRATPRELVALALVALTAGSIPLSLGGWGPREAGSAAAFALAGLGAAAGLAASTAFGVLTMIALLPGAIVLVADRIHPTASIIREETTA